MGMFLIRKSVLKPCTACGRETEHAKRAPNYDTHAFIIFFTCFLWLPITLACALVDWLTPLRCTVCLASGGSAPDR